MEEIRLAAAVAEPTVVEEERREASGGKALSKRPEAVAARPESPCAMTTIGMVASSSTAG
jgi:hypothetical protein